MRERILWIVFFVAAICLDLFEIITGRGGAIDQASLSIAIVGLAFTISTLPYVKIKLTIGLER